MEDVLSSQKETNHDSGNHEETKEDVIPIKKEYPEEDNEEDSMSSESDTKDSSGDGKNVNELEQELNV